MHPIVQRAEALLQSNSHPALQLRELLRLLRPDMDQTLTEARLRTLLGKHPEHIRILESWQGGWRQVAAGSEPSTWVVAVGSSPPPPDGRHLNHRLRESVRWLGCGMDTRSRTDATRWYAIVLTERATRRALVRRAT